MYCINVYDALKTSVRRRQQRSCNYCHFDMDYCNLMYYVHAFACLGKGVMLMYAHDNVTIFLGALRQPDGVVKTYIWSHW